MISIFKKIILMSVVFIMMIIATIGVSAKDDDVTPQPVNPEESSYSEPLPTEDVLVIFDEVWNNLFGGI